LPYRASVEPGGETLAALDMAALRVWLELARNHVLDHALTQWTDSGSVAHGNSFLSEVDNTSISDGALKLASAFL
jgi:hypothetical protein